MAVLAPAANGGRPAASPAPGVAINPVASLKKHPVLALGLFLSIAALGIPYSAIKGKPVYSASTVIFVSPRFVANLQDGGKEFELASNSQYREYVQQQVRTINRFDIVRDALQRLGPLKTTVIRKGETERHATERLQGALVIVPVTDTYQVTITLEGAQKEGLAETVNMVAQTFLERSKTEEFYASDQRLKDLADDRSRLAEESVVKQTRRTALAQELGVTTFTENFVNPYDKLLVDAKVALADSRRIRIQADAALSSMNPSQRPESAKTLAAFAQDLAGKDPSLTSLEANVNQQRSGLMTSISGLGALHPGRKAAEREIAKMDAELSGLYQNLLKQYSSMLLEQKRADAYKTSEIETHLQKQVADQESQASWFTSKYQEGIALGQEMDRERKRLDSIEERVSFLSLERRAPGFVRMFSEARPPIQPSSGGRTKLLAIFLALGLVLGLVTPVAVDFLDPRIHIPADAERVMGFAPIGWLMDKGQSEPDFEREQIFRLAGRIVQEQQAHGSRIFAFSSVKAKGGSTTIVMETAAALTHLGVPALAVEANAYRADARYLKPGARGLTVVLRGRAELASAIIPGDDDLPDHVPVGELEDVRNLPDILNLVTILREATSTYGVILVDLPPLLLSVDAEMIARAADVAVLVVEAETVTKGDLKKAARTLERLQPRAISLVVNRVTADAGGGFGHSAIDEFRTGAPPAPSRWSSPWLWR
jgi:polysaccharide biosynthesis transport protein